MKDNIVSNKDEFSSSKNLISTLTHFTLNALNVSSFLIHALVAFLIIGVATYFMGFQILVNPIVGNDAVNNLTYIVYLDKYFPHIPLWFPYQGGGVSATLGYPQLYSYVVIILHRITGLTFISSMGIVNFLSLFLSAFGTYLFTAIRFNSKAGGLIAGLLFLFSPMAYIWILGAGFLAQTFSVIFVPPFLIFFDWLLDKAFKGRISISLIFLTAFFGALSFLGHPVTYMGLLSFSGVYTAGRIILEGRKNIKTYAFRGLGVFFLSVIATIGLCAFWYLPLQSYLGFANRDITQTLDTSTWAPLQFKGNLGLYGKRSGYPFVDFSIYPPIWIMSLVGVILGVFYNRKVTITGILAFASIYFTGSLTTYVFLAKFSFFIASMFTLRPWYPLSIILNPVAAAMGSVLVARLILTPVFMVEAKRMFLPIKILIKSLRISMHFLLSIILIAVAIYLLNPLEGYYNQNKPWIVPVGQTVLGINLRGIWNRSYKEKCDTANMGTSRLCNMPAINKYFEPNTLWALCDAYPKNKERPLICIGEKLGYKTNEWVEWDTKAQKSYRIVQKDKINVPIESRDVDAFVASCYKGKKNTIYFYPVYSPCLALGTDIISQLKRWPVPEMSFGKDDFYSIVEHFNLPKEKSSILVDENHRIDITPHLGTAVKSWKIFYDSSILNIYTGQLSLIKSFYSIFNDNFYDGKNIEPEVVNNLAKYYGTEAVVVIASKSPMDSFKEAGWEVIGKEAAVIFPPFKTGLASIGVIPKVLVIGSQSKSVYNQVFRNAVSGSIPFDRGLLMYGGESVENYSEEDLAKFDLIIMQGYRYKNRAFALSMLKKYIMNGGSVFVDTGWQYASPDWGKDIGGGKFGMEFQEPFPIQKTEWGGIGQDWSNAKTDAAFVDRVSVSNFGPLSWEGNDWAVASGKEIRQWAKPILAKGDSVLIAGGELEKGKIVWSGMNLIAHAEDKKSREERVFLAKIFDYLLHKKGSVMMSKLNIVSLTPEKFEAKLEKGSVKEDSIYFREAYYPTWRAYAVQSGNKIPLAIQQAGPAFMLADLPDLKPGDSVIFEFGKPIQLIQGVMISLLTLTIFLLLHIDTLLMKGIMVQKLRKTSSTVLVRLGASLTYRLEKRVKRDFTKEEEDY